MDKRIAHELLRPIPATRDELLAAAIQHAGNVARLFEQISAEIARVTEAGDPKFSELRRLIERSRIEDSGVNLMTAAQALGITSTQSCQ